MRIIGSLIELPVSTELLFIESLIYALHHHSIRGEVEGAFGSCGKVFCGRFWAFQVGGKSQRGRLDPVNHP